MTPGAMQVAAFKKHNSPYTWTVVDGVMFYIENKALGHWDLVRRKV